MEHQKKIKKNSVYTIGRSEIFLLPCINATGLVPWAEAAEFNVAEARPELTE